MIRICICGGGSLGHTIAGYVGAKDDYEVRVLTRHPQKWHNTLEIVDINNRHFIGILAEVTDDPSIVIPSSDIVLLCLPGFAIRDTLLQIKPYLRPNTFLGSVVSSTGFFFEAKNIFGINVMLFGFQRVPFIARTIEYGEKAMLKGYKKHLYVATENISDKDQYYLVNTLKSLFDIPVTPLNSHYEASLTNSNPLLHTSRIYSMWKDWKPGIIYDRCPEFYSEWTTEAATLYIKMDNEFQELLKILSVAEGTIPNVLQYYESVDEVSLAEKLRSIPAFRGIKSPMRSCDDKGYVPDFNSRYFIEDFPYGLRYIVEVAHKHNFEIPTIEMVYNWGIKMIENYTAHAI